MKSTHSTEFVDALIAQQHEDGLNDAKFSARLGVQQSTWSLVRRGKREPSTHFVRAALNAYPTLASRALDFFSAPSGTIGNQRVAETTRKATA